MSIITELNNRYATKLFDSSKKISEADMDILLEAIRLSPSSYGFQPYKVLIVEDPKIRAELRTAAYGQSQITDASAILVFSVKYEADEKTADEFISVVSQARNVSVENLAPYGDMIKGTLSSLSAEQLETWVSKQAYIALGFGLVASAVLGIDSCPMEGFSSDEFDRILDLKKLGLKSKIVLAVGYRSAEDNYQHLPKVRYSKEDFFIKY